MIRLSTGYRNMLLGSASFKGIFDGGVIFLFSGTQPASADNAATGTHLGTVTINGGEFNFGSPDNGLVFAAPSAGQINKVASDVWRFTGLANGTIGWARLMGNALDELQESETLPRIDFSVGRSGADMNLSSVQVVQGQSATIDTFGYRIPAQ